MSICNETFDRLHLWHWFVCTIFVFFVLTETLSEIDSSQSNENGHIYWQLSTYIYNIFIGQECVYRVVSTWEIHTYILKSSRRVGRGLTRTQVILHTACSRYYTNHFFFNCFRKNTLPSHSCNGYTWEPFDIEKNMFFSLFMEIGIIFGIFYMMLYLDSLTHTCISKWCFEDSY